MQRHKYTLIIIILAMLSCTNDFENINTNPTSPVDVQPEFLLRKILFNHAENMSYEGFVAGNLLGQYFTAIDFNLFDRHSLTEPQYGGKPWNFIYENLRDNEILLTKAQNQPTYAVYEGPALIMKAYFTATLTDLYGDVPYSQALKGKDGLTTPKYDQQEDIYSAQGGISDNLDQAIIALENYQGAIKLQGDIIYNNDLNKWKKLAKSLKFKTLMRISGQKDVSAELKKLAAENDFISNKSEDAVYHFTQSPPNNFRMSVAKTGDYNLFIMSATADSIMSQLNDPRKMMFFRPTASNSSVYKGLNNGPDATKLSISASDYSLTGRIFREDAANLKANFMTSFEMNFLLAEAAERKLIDGEPTFYYEAGISQSFEYWNVLMPTDYLTRDDVKYKSSNNDALNQIITQKWLGNIINGYEGWIEYRRTGFPVLKPVSASLNNNIFPVRMPYPTSEAAFNNSNFLSASSATNNNSVNFPVWWDQ